MTPSKHGGDGREIRIHFTRLLQGQRDEISKLTLALVKAWQTIG